jgi:uroporphyrinogen-III synthase
VREPLAGRGVAVTRAEEPGGPLERRLRAAGATVLRWNTFRIAPPADPAPLVAAAGRLSAYDWIVFPSAHAAAALGRALAALPVRRGLPLRGARVAAVGPSTANAARRAGWPVDEVPGDSQAGAAGLLARLGRLDGARILLPQSNLARPELAEGLSRLGGSVEAIEAYRIAPANLDGAACLAQLSAGAVDIVTFTSPSAVDALAKALAPSGLASLDRCQVISIGPTTSARLLALGRPPDAQAAASTLDGLVATLAR